MKLSECKYGILVKEVGTGFIGMVTGITQNEAGEAIPVIKWQNRAFGERFHHSRLEVYND